HAMFARTHLPWLLCLTLPAAAIGATLQSTARAQTKKEEANAHQPAKVIVKTDVVYGSVLGAGLVADIAYPEGKGPFPVILSVHGGRWVASKRTDAGEGAIDVEKWAGFGLFAMTIDYRLAGGTPPPACYQDLQCAIRWVHAHADKYPIDRERV